MKGGKGKEYDNYGKLLFEGEYLNETRWNGNEIIYDNNGKVTKVENILNGKNINNGLCNCIIF